MNKTKKNKIFLGLLSFVLLIFFKYEAYANELESQAPPEAVEAAKKMLKIYMERENRSKDKVVSFIEECSFDEIIFGKPFRYMFVTESGLSNATAVSDLFVEFGRNWVFPVICGGSVRIVIEMEKPKDHWKMQSIGRNKLAEKLNSLKRVVGGKKFGKLKGLIRMYQPPIAAAVIGGEPSLLEFYPLNPNDWNKDYRRSEVGQFYLNAEDAKKLFIDIFREYKGNRGDPWL